MTNTPTTTNWMHGMSEEWDQTTEGHHAIYYDDPSTIPARSTARVIYELRLDVDRLASEVIAAR